MGEVRSVADELRDEQRERARSLSVDARMSAAFEGARVAVVSYARTHGVTLAKARRIFERRAQLGRRPSRCNEP